MLASSCLAEEEEIDPFCGSIINFLIRIIIIITAFQSGVGFE